ncbi:hypothetical protein KSF_025110 [Reticulibacter mediterranei]|uniref:SnoaL-like domain-containing protein n=1 Tax=Reticulibacter mediterranei TaxID=2778369 RepID=A0A8J3IF73_9CHLR|nr:nuclear transport factor 2 family protein [Reticulibacter mediterranei]GHO92463.1 hypothetical protein KSF_025110 [Reticulibacter mediterranei]
MREINHEDVEDLIRAFMTALEENNQEEFESYLADDFRFSGWTPRPLSRAGFLDLFKGLKEGIPGLIFNLHNVLVQNDTTVTGTWKISGYQSDSFILPVLGLPPIPQMAASISLPAEEVEYRLTGNKIVGLNVTHTPGGGIKGLLNQLGVDIPLVS